MAKHKVEYEGKLYPSKAELARQKGVVIPSVFLKRLRTGMPVKEALITPLNPHLLTEKDFHRVAADKRWKWLGKSVPRNNAKTGWECDQGHVITKGYNETLVTGCLKCYGEHKTIKGKQLGIKPPRKESLAVTHPEIAAEWHPTKNGKKTPFDVTYGSKDEIIWICPKSELHDYPMIVTERTRGSNCSYCAGKRVAPDTCLEYKFPEIAAEWHPTKNGKITPHDVTARSDVKRWWLCQRGHKWKVSPNSRLAVDGGTWCPDCRMKTSRLEIRLYAELKTMFDDASWRKNSLGTEVDLLFPSQRIGIEIDGSYWHANKVEQDRKKNKILEEHGYTLVRLRGKGLPLIGQHDVVFDETQSAAKAIRTVLSKLHELVSGEDKGKIHSYLSRKKYANDKEYRKIIANLPSPPAGESLEDQFPEVAKFWDHEANAPLTPDMFPPKSSAKVWWKCAFKDYHPSYQAVISNRVVQKECLYCRGVKLHKLDSLAFAYPEVVKDWDYEKNKVAPDTVKPGSRKPSFHWKCSKCGYKWQSSANRRCVGKARCLRCVTRARKRSAATGRFG